MKYVLYCRKSSESEDRQVLSLDSQESELKKIAAKEHLEIVEVLKESMSAKEPGRPLFSKMLSMVQRGKAQGVLCWKLDRLARNPKDDGEIKWLLQSGKIQCIKTYERDYFPNDNVLISSVEFAMANQYVRDLSMNVKRGNRAKLERGEWPNHAPFGYRNDRATKTVVINKKESAAARRIFELYVSGRYNLKDLANVIYAEGYRTSSGNKLAKSMMHKVLRNPFYCGLMLRDGQLYVGNHKPLVSKEVFDLANDMLNGNHKAKKRKHFAPMRGFMICDVCGCLLTYTLQKRRYGYYYCTNGKHICHQRNKHLTTDEAASLMADVLQKLHFDDQLVELGLEAYKEVFDSRAGSIEEVRQNRLEQLKRVKEKQGKLTDLYLAEGVPEDVYGAKMTALKNEEITLKSQLNSSDSLDVYPSITFEQMRSAFLRANNAGKLFLAGDDEEKRKLLENLLSNCKVKDKKVASYQFKKEYQGLALASKTGGLDEMLRDLDSNQDTMLQRHVSYH